MNIRKEQGVLIGAALLLGWMLYGDLQTVNRRPSARGGRRPDFQEHPAPDLSLAQPLERNYANWRRNIFAEPSDTRPLPPLALARPRLDPLPMLAPPSSLDLSASLFNELLRTRAPAEPEVIPGLFVIEADAESLADQDGGGSLLEQLSGLSEQDPATLTPEERQELFESYKRLYDWIKLAEGDTNTLFGHIINEDRYALASRPLEGIQFQEVDRRTGELTAMSRVPVTFARERIQEFGFSDTIENRIRLDQLELEGEFTPGMYSEVLAIADEWVGYRLDSPIALPHAQALYERLVALDPEDPKAYLGLGRCMEAGFQFQDAWEHYNGLAEGRFSGDPLVHVRLGQLEARLRLFESARRRFEHAESLGGRTRWDVQWALGRFLYDLREYDDSVAHLAVAYEREPNTRIDRTAIRNDYGAALLAVGRVDEALTVFDGAYNASPEEDRQAALAGIRSSVLLGAKQGSGAPEVDLAADQLEFDLLVTEALERMGKGVIGASDAAAAEVLLTTAASTDPLRAYIPWRALSYLAERTGYPAEALDYIERAYDNNPTDPWTLFQLGRLNYAQDQLDLAGESLLAALDQEIDFVDALVYLAEVSIASGDFPAAERYYERALSIEDDEAWMYARRGLNLLELTDFQGASVNFERALDLVPGEPLARLGAAWVTYRDGDAGEAVQEYADLDDDRRAQPDDDPWRVYARGQMERIRRHVEKVAWTDLFERRTLRNNWLSEQANGPIFELDEGRVRMHGAFERDGTVRLYRTRASSSFLSFEAELTIARDNNARAGIFLTRELARSRSASSRPTAGVWIARHKDGNLQTRVMQNSNEDAEWVDHRFPDWPKEQPIRLRIERAGEGSDAVGRIFVDEFVVLEGIPLRQLVSTTGQVNFGVFIEGEDGRMSHLHLDNVEVVYIEPQ